MALTPEGPMSDADRRRLYALGCTDTPDRLAAARGLGVAALMGAAALVGMLLPTWIWCRP